MDDDIPYRTPFQTLAPAQSVSSTDENEFSTLVQVAHDFAEELEKLHDFNAFEIDKKKTPTERAKLLLHEVEINQKVYDILMPLYEALTGTVGEINSKYREKLNNGR